MPRGHRRHGRRRRHHHEPNPHQSDHAPHRQASQHRVRHATEHVRSSQQPRHGGRTALRRLVVPRFPREAPHFHERLVPALHGLPRRPAGSRPSDFGGDGRRCPPLAPHVKAVHLRARGAGTRGVEAGARVDDLDTSADCPDARPHGHGPAPCSSAFDTRFANACAPPTAPIRPTQQRTGPPRGAPGLLLCQEAGVSPCAPRRRPRRARAAGRARARFATSAGVIRPGIRASPLEHVAQGQQVVLVGAAPTRRGATQPPGPLGPALGVRSRLRSETRPENPAPS